MRIIIGFLLLLPFTAFADVTFYGQCEFKGPGVTLKAGQYSASDLAKVGIPEDAIASVKIEGNFTVVMFENDGFKGRSGSLKRSSDCLDNSGFSNLVSSLQINAPKATFGAKEPITFGNSTLQPKKPVTAAGVVTVYSECNYDGISARLEVGDYNLAQLIKLGLRNNDISAVKVPEGMSITVYENDFLRGYSASTSSDVQCIDAGDFANRITSVSVSGEGVANVAAPAKIVSEGVTVFTECAYKGKSATLREGEYNNAQMNELGIQDNTISALQVSDGYQVELFMNDFQRGDSGVLSTNNPCLLGRYSDAVSSMIVRKTGTGVAGGAESSVVTLYAHCNYRGGSAQLPVGNHDINALKKAGVKENSVSSIKLSPGYRAVVYSGPSFNSKSLVLTADDDCLDNDDMNEQLSSIVIESVEVRASDKLVAQPNQSSSSKSDDLVAGLTCVQDFVNNNACDASRWSAMESRCQLARVEELSDGYLKGHVEAGNCKVELWDELVRRTANPHLR